MARRELRKPFRGLRFRLTLSYAVLFTALLTFVALLFRERLTSVMDQQVENRLDAEWKALKGYMRIERDYDFDDRFTAAWYYDLEDPDETTITLDLRKIYIVTDQEGHVIPDWKTKQPAVSTGYEDLGIDKPADIKARVAAALSKTPKRPDFYWMDRRTSSGEPVRVRWGVVYAEGHGAPFYAAIGASYAENERILRAYTWIYAGVIPAALILGSLLGYFMAGRALTPVLEVARTAQRISGSNLSLRIPSRETGD
jgi:hypothetical protein